MPRRTINTRLPKYRWITREGKSHSNVQACKAISNATGTSDLLAQILVVRGIDTPDEASAFLNPKSISLLPPESIPGLEQARDRLLVAALAREQVLVHGDYDADGISGAVILHKVLKEIGCKSRIFLPDRSTHGYGFASQAVKNALKAGIGLIVTVDCGISSIETVRQAREAGIDVIVTDHHSIPDTLPTDAILVHPELEGDYPGGKIAGASVAFKLALSLIEAFKGDVDSARDLYLPLVALATVADVCDLTLENRAIVAQGLPGIPISKLPGLKILCQSGMKGSIGEITERDIGFKMAPVLNAAGRMGNPSLAAKLLLSKTDEEAWKHLRDLDSLNRDRRKAQETVSFRLSRRPEVSMPDNEAGLLILVDDDCTPGLSGLAASKLAERTGRPTCILVPGDDDSGPLYRGSMRGTNGENLLELMAPVASIAERLGGHAGALGLTVRPEKIADFIKACSEIKWTPQMPILQIDLEIENAPHKPDIVKDLEKTRPWGPGNPQPAFQWGPVTVKGTRAVGKELEHVQVSLHDASGALYKGIGFNLACEIPDNSAVGKDISAAGHFQLNDWQGTVTVQFEIKDFHFL
jgi:single-stranded-DNA-specific exonuclease